MRKATADEKELVVTILVQSFDDNKSVNYTIKQDTRRRQRIRKLMEYSFEICSMFGNVFISDDNKGCALVVMPDKKRTTFKSIWLDVRLVFGAIGIVSARKAMSRETAIKKIHPNDALYYLWFIGVQPSEQGKGIGSRLLTEVIQEGKSKRRTVCLETSTLKNIRWYEKHGFKTYRELDFGYTLYCMKIS
ncbi:MAG TPA: GNAT family N-acetyltransferase [Bacteroidia bacterium]|nr:GNAT family N-acetyltransferase [Bacteroidia bacterium]